MLHATRTQGVVVAISICLGSVAVVGARADDATTGRPTHVLSGHPRLYLTASDLPRLRAKRHDSPVSARIWKNLAESADWCAKQHPRTEWIPTIAPDPKFENLYDRFYAAMHDMAMIEHLAFASALSEPGHDPYFVAAREWALAGARVWGHEAHNQPDASKAYSVLRILKGLAVAYDLLYDRLTEPERATIRQTLVSVGRAYFVFFADPVNAGEGYNKHHGSVDAAPLGIVALALLGEVPDVQAWLDRMIEKHVHYLLPHALTPSGTNDQSSNFWASTVQYRILFLDALRRVTGRDLFAEFPDALPGRIALAAVASKLPRDVEFNEVNRTVLFAPDYGQIDYWAPDLIFMARQEKRPIYQHLALWDGALGRLQRTRFITPRKKEELLFAFGGYAYIWYDPTIPDAVEPDLPRAFEFPEPEVCEAYLRNSYNAGDLMVGFKKGELIVHAGGERILVDRFGSDEVNKPSPPVSELLITDDGRRATIRCVGPTQRGLSEQRVLLERAGNPVSRQLTIRRETNVNLSWWYSGTATRSAQTLRWPDGTRLTVTRGHIKSIDAHGFTDRKAHYGGMQFADPHPFVYPVVTASPERGVLEITVNTEPK